LERFAGHAKSPAVVWRERTNTYADLLDLYEAALSRLDLEGVTPGSCVAVVGDYSPMTISCLLALAARRCIAAPLDSAQRRQSENLFQLAQISHVIGVDDDDRLEVQSSPADQTHPLLRQLRSDGQAGLILFSSGSSGEPKAVLHSLPRLLDRLRQPRPAYSTVGFLLFDHIGGLNTLFSTLANCGRMILPNSRRVAHVASAIEEHGAELLPTTPSFLNMMLLAQAHRSHDLSSLKLITYGTEVMPERTLARMNDAFPHARIKQTYGLTELGILSTRSASKDSVRFEIDQRDCEARTVDGRLQLRANTSMLGYLNAPSPFDAQGWFDTGDSIEQDGNYYRVLGRASDIINCGGQKVFPAEVEQVIAEMPDILDVSVVGEQHMLLGEIVTATVQLKTRASPVETKRRIRRFCRDRLHDFMIPAKVRVVTEPLLNHRYKKTRIE
jgi:acyl-CoA synthetase (AMP-forming)/AMP-acid ligase II